MARVDLTTSIVLLLRIASSSFLILENLKSVLRRQVNTEGRKGVPEDKREISAELTLSEKSFVTHHVSGRL